MVHTVLKNEHFLSTYVKQKYTIFFIPFRAKQAKIEKYGNIMKLKKKKKGASILKLPTPTCIQKALKGI